MTAVSTLAGGVGGFAGLWADATGASAGFNEPAGVAVDSSGNVYVADKDNYRIRKVTPLGGTQFSHFLWFSLFRRHIIFAPPAGPCIVRVYSSCWLVWMHH